MPLKRAYEIALCALLMAMVATSAAAELRPGDILVSSYSLSGGFVGDYETTILSVDPHSGTQEILLSVEGDLISALTVDDSGHVLFGDFSCISRLNPTTDSVSEILCRDQTPFFLRARAMEFDPDAGAVIVANSSLPTVFELDPNSGDYTGVTGEDILSDVVFDAAIDPDGDILVVAGTNTSVGPAVVRIDRATGAQSVVSAGGMLDVPYAVAVESDGFIVVVDRSDCIIVEEELECASREILRIDPRTGQQEVVSSGGLLIAPNDLTVDGRGKIIVVDFLSGVVQVHPRTGNQTTISVGGVLREPGVSGQSPVDVAIVPDGFVPPPPPPPPPVAEPDPTVELYTTAEAELRPDIETDVPVFFAVDSHAAEETDIPGVLGWAGRGFDPTGELPSWLFRATGSMRLVGFEPAEGIEAGSCGRLTGNEVRCNATSGGGGGLPAVRGPIGVITVAGQSAGDRLVVNAGFVLQDNHVAAAKVKLAHVPGGRRVLYGVEEGGEVWTLDLETGVAEFLAAIGAGIGGLATDIDGTIFALQKSSVPGNLYAIDPGSRTVTTVGRTRLRWLGGGGLSFNPASGLLYGAAGDDAIPFRRGVLVFPFFTFGRGRATVIGYPGNFSLSGLAFDQIGDFYSRTGLLLIVLDPLDASPLRSVPLSAPLSIRGMTVDPGSGAMVVSGGGGVPEGIYEVDMWSGEVERVVLTAKRLTGLTFGWPVELLGPAEQSQVMIDRFDAAEAEGGIVGTGGGHSSSSRIRMMRATLAAIERLVSEGQDALACARLRHALLRTDGEPQPADPVEGSALEELNHRLGKLWDGIRCESTGGL